MIEELVSGAVVSGPVVSGAVVSGAAVTGLVTGLAVVAMVVALTICIKREGFTQATLKGRSEVKGVSLAGLPRGTVCVEQLKYLAKSGSNTSSWVTDPWSRTPKPSPSNRKISHVKKDSSTPSPQCDTVTLELGETPGNHGNTTGNHGNTTGNHGNTTGNHCNTTGNHCNTTGNHCNTTGNHGNTTGNDTEAQLSHIEAEGTELIESTKADPAEPAEPVEPVECGRKISPADSGLCSDSVNSSSVTG